MDFGTGTGTGVAEGGKKMTTGGLIVMLFSVGSVLTLVTFCLFRVLSLPPVEMEEHLRGSADIDTGDIDDPD